ncbi:MAG: two-component system response regulator [Thermodesulfovibrionales bacterium]|nr:two-component system response regulator [Thermodesulfovibrionales bacterium]
MADVLSFEQKPIVLVVDDTPANLALVSSLLKDVYTVKVANKGSRALQVAAAKPMPDLILLDIMMPEMDGYEVIQKLKENPETADIPVIFLTAKAEVEDEQKGFELGAVDYITKPISPPIVLARVKTHLTLKTARDFLKDKNEYLEIEIKRRIKELTTAQDMTIMAMASLAETRDSDTGNHIRRIQSYVKLLAKKLQKYPRFGYFLTDENIELLYKSAPLHDIGKVGIPDRILLKPDRLTPEEFEIMKSHTLLGKHAIEEAEKLCDEKNTFLSLAGEICLYHHEKWDCSGYPLGIGGDEIPISARLMAIADVYDALICRRVYKDPLPHEEAVKIIKEGWGIHFDPDVTDAFVENADEFLEIAEHFKDTDKDIEEKIAFLKMVNLDEKSCNS